MPAYVLSRLWSEPYMSNIILLYTCKHNLWHNLLLNKQTMLYCTIPKIPCPSILCPISKTALGKKSTIFVYLLVLPVYTRILILFQTRNKMILTNKRTALCCCVVIAQCTFWRISYMIQIRGFLCK